MKRQRLSTAHTISLPLKESPVEMWFSWTSLISGKLKKGSLLTDGWTNDCYPDMKGRNLKMAEKSRVIILALANEELVALFIACTDPEPTVCGFLYMMQYLTALIAAFYFLENRRITIYILLFTTQEQQCRISISKWFAKTYIVIQTNYGFNHLHFSYCTSFLKKWV